VVVAGAAVVVAGAAVVVAGAAVVVAGTAVVVAGTAVVVAWAAAAVSTAVARSGAGGASDRTRNHQTATATTRIPTSIRIGLGSPRLSTTVTTAEPP
ncbi:MAG: hypothetical protein VX450_02365, partial [Actinomycetota bacterium]|nr:hypothetical protein [Actinomycetota bacterium]MED6329320.1 hypothetical protein [Actinomycetota bacterium]